MKPRCCVQVISPLSQVFFLIISCSGNSTLCSYIYYSLHTAIILKVLLVYFFQDLFYYISGQKLNRHIPSPIWHRSLQRTFYFQLFFYLIIYLYFSSFSSSQSTQRTFIVFSIVNTSAFNSCITLSKKKSLFLLYVFSLTFTTSFFSLYRTSQYSSVLHILDYLNSCSLSFSFHHQATSLPSSVWKSHQVHFQLYLLLLLSPSKFSLTRYLTLLRPKVRLSSQKNNNDAHFPQALCPPASHQRQDLYDSNKLARRTTVLFLYLVAY